MKIEKIGVTTGEPFAETGDIVLKGDGDFYNMHRKSGYWVGQCNFFGKGVRQATLEEIKNHWNAIKDHWDPQPGDLVRVTQGSFANGNDYVINEPFKDDLNYWRVSYLDGSSYNVFDKDQMVLSPNHGWEANSTPEAVIEPQPRWKVGDYVTYKSREDCKNHKYHFGASCQGGYKGEITSYKTYKSGFNCFTIEVMTRRQSSFTMLECEFEEWDNPNFQNSIKPETKVEESNKEAKFSPEVCSEAFINLDLGLWELIQARVSNNVRPYKTLDGVIYGGFSWQTSEEGGDFWNSIRNFLQRKDYISANTEYLLNRRKDSKTLVFPEPVIDKKVEFTIRDRVLRFDGHEVKAGDTVSFRYTTNQKEPKEIFISNQQVTNIEFDRYTGDLPFKLGDDWRYIHKVKDFVNHGQPAQLIKSDIGVPFSSADITISSVDYQISPPNEKVLFTNPIKKEKSVSDYQQKPLTLYKSKTKLSLKPIKL
jgi:hypothetical protein